MKNKIRKAVTIAFTISSLFLHTSAYAFDLAGCEKVAKSIKNKVEGFSPQKVMQKCFNNTFLKGEGINKFEKCVSHHVRKDIKEVAQADRIVATLVKKIKHKCT